MVFKWVDDIVFHGNPPPKKPSLRQKYAVKKDFRKQDLANQAGNQVPATGRKRVLKRHQTDAVAKPSHFQRFGKSLLFA
jgi:hypothetical protein